MKKLLLLVCVSLIGLVSYSQKFTFSKGNIPNGKINSAKTFEDFLIERIKVIDDKGIEYSFISAKFTEKTSDGITISFTLTNTAFPEDKRGDIARASVKGTTYTFSNVVVKDSNGKQYIIPSMKYEFVGFGG